MNKMHGLQDENSRYSCCDIQDNTKNSLTAGVAPITDDNQNCDELEIRLYGDAAYSSKHNIALCVSHGVKPIIPHKINSIIKDLGTGVAWDDSVRDQLNAGRNELSKQTRCRTKA